MLRAFSLTLLGLFSSVLALDSLSAAGLGVTPEDQFSLLDGFEVELLYDVPSDTQGSWVSLTVDPQGHQYDKKEHILPLNGGSEHGPHALILTPDKKRIIKSVAAK